MANESDLINRIAKWEKTIVGVKESYGAFQNPNNIQAGLAPCVLHYPPSFDAGLHAHHNRWMNTLVIRSILLVAPRQLKGANISYLENDAMPFLAKWRQKFQSQDVVLDMLSVAPNTSRAFLVKGSYGAGGELMTVNGIPWIGCIFDFSFTEIA